MSTQVEFLVREYVVGWRWHDKSRVAAVVADDCHVVESDGSEYSSRDAILRWLDHWVASGSKVEEWTISSLLADEAGACAEWQFTCVCCGNRSSFRGASVFRVRNGKITSVTEYRREKMPNQLPRATGQEKVSDQTAAS